LVVQIPVWPGPFIIVPKVALPEFEAQRSIHLDFELIASNSRAAAGREVGSASAE
jgi:hypothetical protein